MGTCSTSEGVSKLATAEKGHGSTFMMHMVHRQSLEEPVLTHLMSYKDAPHSNSGLSAEGPKQGAGTKRLRWSAAAGVPSMLFVAAAWGSCMCMRT